MLHLFVLKPIINHPYSDLNKKNKKKMSSVACPISRASILGPKSHQLWVQSRFNLLQKKKISLSGVREMVYCIIGIGKLVILRGFHYFGKFIPNAFIEFCESQDKTQRIQIHFSVFYDLMGPLLGVLIGWI